MNKYIFDFDTIPDLKAFYLKAKKEMSLPAYFGNNLDALWDCLTGYISLPAGVAFVNLTSPKLEQFDYLINLFQEAEDELDGQLAFSYYIKKDY